MAKKNPIPELATASPEPATATVPTPLAPEDLMCAPGYTMVKEADYNQLIETTKILIGQKRTLHEQNEAYKNDLHTMIKCLVELQPLVGNGGFNPAAIMKLVANKDKLTAGLTPMFEVIAKYTTPADAAQLSE